jgi:hypothetical protein
MDNVTKELAEKALNELLTTMSRYAKERPYDTEGICALSTGITAVLPIASCVSIAETSGVNCENKSLSVSEAAKELEHYRNTKSQSLPAKEVGGMQNKAAVEGIEGSLKKFYEEIKDECKTYGELKRRISMEAKRVAWNKRELGICINSMLLKFLDEEISSLPIQG